jgi:hypothetical protein
MGSFLLSKLPDALWGVILVQWLGLKHAVRLDSAVCSRALRPRFLSLAYGKHTAFTVKPSTRHYGQLGPLLSWLVARRAQLTEICVDARYPLDYNLFDTFLVISRTAIRSVQCHNAGSDCGLFQQALLDVAKRCPNVEHVHVQSGNGRLPCDSWLATFTRSFAELSSLSLYHVPLSEEGLGNVLISCRCLERLYITAANLVIPPEVALPTLKSIRVHSPYLRDNVLIAIGRNCAKLESLKIFAPHDCPATDVGVRAVLQGCPLLRETDVEYAAAISTDLRAELARRNNTRDLNLADWRNMSDELTRRVLRVCPNLCSLNCDNSPWLSDATLAVCAQHCPQLECIKLVGCPHVTSSGFGALVSTLTNKLRTVILLHCAQLGDETALAIAKHCPQLEYFQCLPEVSDAAMAEVMRRCRRIVLTTPWPVLPVDVIGLRARIQLCAVVAATVVLLSMLVFGLVAQQAILRAYFVLLRGDCTIPLFRSVTP